MTDYIREELTWQGPRGSSVTLPLSRRSSGPRVRHKATHRGSRQPMYWRLLHLRRLRPNAWQRALLAEGVATVAAVLVLADLASAWALVILPLAVAAVVKGHDLLAGAVIEPAIAPIGLHRLGRVVAAPRGRHRRASRGRHRQARGWTLLKSAFT